MSVAVAIPTIGKSPLLWPLIEQLDADPAIDEVWVMDNGLPADERVRLMDFIATANRTDRADTRGHSIYAQWNNAIGLAHTLGLDYLAILNDDIRLAPNTMTYLSALLDGRPDLGLVCPDPRTPLDVDTVTFAIRCVSGTYRQGGITGFAFMVRATDCPRVDEDYEVWFGDDDLFAKIEAQGYKAAIVGGLPIEHQESTSINAAEWVPAAIERDVARWKAKGNPWP